MFHQSLTPIGGSLLLSFLVASLPIVTVLVMLGILRRPAWQASLGGLVMAILPWRMRPVPTDCEDQALVIQLEMKLLTSC